MNGMDVNNGFMNASTVNDRLASVYRLMGLGMAAAAAVAYSALQVPALLAFAKSPAMLVLMIALFALVFFIGKVVDKWGPESGRLAFFLIAASMGLIMAPTAKIYSAASLAQAFGISCLVLFVAAAYGYSTKKSLASMGAFMMVGLLGIIVAGIINLFLHNGVMQMVLDAATIVIFTGLAAWDSQRIRDELISASTEQADKIVVLGALSMWLNFVNLFDVILRLSGEKD